MTEPYGPQAIWGRELRHYRHAAGLTQTQLGELVHFSESLISGIETGQLPASADFAQICDEALNTGGALSRLLDWRKGDRFPTWFGEWPKIEARATVLRTFELAVAPGLLQTKAYANALLDGDEDLVAARMERQRILCRDEPTPPKLRCILDEAVLYRPAGDSVVMREQLEYLIEAAASPRTTVQLIPHGIHPGVQGSFVIASLGAAKGEVAYVESASRGQIARSPFEIEALTDVWESLQTYSLSQRESLQLIRRVVEEKWT